MAEETKTPGGGDPSKVNLNPHKTGNGDTDKVRLSQPGQTPPKIQLRAADVKKSTTRIDLADVKPPPASSGEELTALTPEKQAEFFKKSTIRIEQQAPAQMPSEAKRSTVRLDQAGGPAGETQKFAGETSQIDSKRSTIRLDQGGQAEAARADVLKTTMRLDQPSGTAQPSAGETGPLDSKRSTIRIDESAAGTQKMPAETSRIDVKKSTIRIEALPQTGSETQRTGTGGETRRIDLKTVETGQLKPAPVPAAPAAPVPPGATAKISDTQQMRLKKETTRLEIPPEVAKRQTGRIQTAQVGEPADVFKKRTGKVTTSPIPAPPVVPVTPVVPTSPSGGPGSETVSRPKTILVRRPQKPAEVPGRPSAVTQVLAEQTAQARKSETARLEIPKDAAAEERPTTRPKTIRIKRPDGTTARKALTIARPEAGEESSLPEGLREPAALLAREKEPGGFWAILAIAATLVLGAIIYVLLAQTYAPDLPFPGKFI